MNSALATLVLVTPVKKSVMLTPNTMPGTSARRHVGPASAKRRSLTRRIAVQMTLDASMRQKAMVGPGVPAFLTIVEPALKRHARRATIATRPIGRDAWRTRGR